MNVIAYSEHLLSLLFTGFIVAFLFCIQSGESIYDSLRFSFILGYL